MIKMTEKFPVSLLLSYVAWRGGGKQSDVTPGNPSIERL